VKRYTIIILPAAERDIGEAYKWLAARDADAAVLWYNRLLDEIFSLEFFPSAPRSLRKVNLSTRKSAKFSTGAVKTSIGFFSSFLTIRFMFFMYAMARDGIGRN
jgi:plasmid stabilization system protein ParE